MPVMAIVEARSPVQYAKLPAGGGDIAAWSLREVSTPEPARPRLLDRVRHALRARHMSRRTEEAYVAWIWRYIFFHGRRRVLECCRLRVQDIDFATNQIVVRGGKGDKDRVTMLPATTKTNLARHLEAVRAQHHRDVSAGAGWVELPTALSRKYPNAGREWVWQWVFPATRVYRDRLTGQRRRHHLHESALQRAVKVAVCRAGLPKRASPHTLPLVRDAPAGGWPRHPDRPGAAWAPGRDYHHDLRARPESRAGRGEKPSGSDVRPMTPPAALEAIRIGIRCAPSQAISTRAGRSLRPQTAGSKRRCAASVRRLQIAFDALSRAVNGE